MKKKYKMIAGVCLLIIIIGVILYYLLPITAFSYTTTFKQRVDDFGLYKDDFETIIAVTDKYFESVKDEKGEITDNYLRIGFDKESKNHYLYHDHRLDLSKKEQASLNRITEEAFVSELDSKLCCIRFSSDRISFHIEGGHYALVYSFDDKPPTYVNEPNDDEKVLVQRADKNWYHIFRNTLF